jgi:NTE family protein
MARAKPRPKIALVMSGGGARGAYEAGILAYLYGELPHRLGRPVHFDIITGSSVGAVNACYMAASQDDPDAAERLIAIWGSLSFEEVFRVGITEVFTVPWKLLGLGRLAEILPATSDHAPERLPGVFDTEWLESIVVESVNWKKIRARIEDGSLHALAVTATEIATGRSVVFVDGAEDRVEHWGRDPFVIARPGRITAEHALASAAIPLLFPGVRVGGAYYCDGGLRLNTPLSPALRLGADRLLVIGLRHPRTAEEEDRVARRRNVPYTSPTYLIGKALNALLLDRVVYDVDRLRRFNALLEAGTRLYGEDFTRRMSDALETMHPRPYRIVRDALIQPSKDLGELALECLNHQPPNRGVRDWLSRNIARYAARGAAGEADLLSYLLFDRCYAQHLIELGRHDAAAMADELIDFFTVPE